MIFAANLKAWFSTEYSMSLGASPTRTAFFGPSKCGSPSNSSSAALSTNSRGLRPRSATRSLAAARLLNISSRVTSKPKEVSLLCSALEDSLVVFVTNLTFRPDSRSLKTKKLQFYNQVTWLLPILFISQWKFNPQLLLLHKMLKQKIVFKIIHRAAQVRLKYLLIISPFEGVDSSWNSCIFNVECTAQI